jgi:hypothetical protein
MSCRFPRAHHHAQRIIVAKAKRAAIDAENARRAASDHLQKSTRAQTKLLKPANMGSGPNQLTDFGDLPRTKRIEGNKFSHGRSDKVVEIESQYVLSADSSVWRKPFQRGNKKKVRRWKIKLPMRGTAFSGQNK